MKDRCENQKRNPMTFEHELGRMLGKNIPVARLFDVKVTKAENDSACIEWSKKEAHRDWATLGHEPR